MAPGPWRRREPSSPKAVHGGHPIDAGLSWSRVSDLPCSDPDAGIVPVGDVSVSVGSDRHIARTTEPIVAAGQDVGDCGGISGSMRRTGYAPHHAGPASQWIIWS